MHFRRNVVLFTKMYVTVYFNLFLFGLRAIGRQIWNGNFSTGLNILKWKVMYLCDSQELWGFD